MALMDERRTEEFAAKLLQKVAEREGVDVRELPPIHDEIDPDALESVLRTGTGGDVTVEFSYLGYRVTARSDGDVSVERSEAR